jgi:hypothetical protein
VREVEIGIAGAVGDLARWALPGVVVEQNQRFVAAETELAAVLERLAAAGVDVRDVRERAVSCGPGSTSGTGRSTG